MKAYIENIVSLAPRRAEQVTETIPHFTLIEPPYARHISSGEGRRMSRFTKMGMYASLECLQEAGATTVDAITVGTGLGAFGCFEKFEQAIHAGEEAGLSPTPFIQSLPNALAGQIALSLNCRGYSMTHVHRGCAFESALLDGMMLLQEQTNPQTVLVGAIDELTATYVQLLEKSGYAKPGSAGGPVPMEGGTPGEGSTFLLLSTTETPRSLARIEGLEMLFEPPTTADIQTAIENLLAESGLSLPDVDTVLSGRSGDSRFDKKLTELETDYLVDKPVHCFKESCGEYQTAAAYALWAATRPEVTTTEPTDSLQRLLIINQYQDCNYSLLLLSRFPAKTQPS